MGLCRDKATNYLAQLGYSVVRIPRENIKPLQLIGRDRDQMKLGTLDQLLTNPETELPAITYNQIATQISGQNSSKMHLSIGIGILGNVLGALAGTQMGIDAAYKQARTIQFEFKDVLLDSILPLSMGQYLRNAKIDIGNPVLERYILGKGQLYVITETLKSWNLTVKAENSKEGSLALDIPVIQNMAKGKLNVDCSQASNGAITYMGNKDKPLTFGFKCFRIGIEDGDLSVAAAAPDEVAMASGAGARERVLGSGLVDFDEGDLLS